jgi:hypothetical protein
VESSIEDEPFSLNELFTSNIIKAIIGYLGSELSPTYNIFKSFAEEHRYEAISWNKLANDVCLSLNLKGKDITPKQLNKLEKALNECSGDVYFMVRNSTIYTSFTLLSTYYLSHMPKGKESTKFQIMLKILIDDYLKKQQLNFEITVKWSDYKGYTGDWQKVYETLIGHKSESRLADNELIFVSRTFGRETAETLENTLNETLKFTINNRSNKAVKPQALIKARIFSQSVNGLDTVVNTVFIRNKTHLNIEPGTSYTESRICVSLESSVNPGYYRVTTNSNLFAYSMLLKAEADSTLTKIEYSDVEGYRSINRINDSQRLEISRGI